MLAGSSGRQGVLQVGLVRGADVDDVDGGVGEQSANGVIGPADVVLARIGRGPFRAAAHHRDDIAVSLGTDRTDHPLRRDSAGADECPAEGIGHRLAISFGTGPQVPRTTSEGARISCSGGSPRVGDAAQHRRRRTPPELLRIDRDGGERRQGVARAGDIVEADHAEVAAHHSPRFVQGIQNAEGHHVAEAESRCRGLFEIEDAPQCVHAAAAVERCRHDQGGIRHDAGRLQREAVAAHSLGGDAGGVAAAEKGDAPVAERQQSLGGHARAQDIVGHDRTQPSVRHPAHDLDDRHVPIGHGPRLPDAGAKGRAEDEAGRAVLAHGLHDPALACRVLPGVGHERDVAGGFQRLFQPDSELREEGVGQVVDDHGDHVAGLASEIGGVAVVDVAEAVDRFLDPAPGLALDERAVAQHQRDGRARHAGGTGQVGYRDPPACLARLLLSVVHAPCFCRQPVRSVVLRSIQQSWQRPEIIYRSVSGNRDWIDLICMARMGVKPAMAAAPESRRGTW